MSNETDPVKLYENSSIPTPPATPSYASTRKRSNGSAQGQYFPYGRRDSGQRTRFLLVRTSNQNGKETYKRITLPGGGNVAFLHLTIERAMQMGRVSNVFTLPDRLIVSEDEQIAQFDDCQKVEVEFEKHQSIENGSNRKGSLPIAISEKPFLHKLAKAHSTNDEPIAKAVNSPIATKPPPSPPAFHSVSQTLFKIPSRQRTISEHVPKPKSQAIDDEPQQKRSSSAMAKLSHEICRIYDHFDGPVVAKLVYVVLGMLGLGSFVVYYFRKLK